MSQPLIDRYLAEVRALHPAEIELSLGRMERLLASLGNPEQRLPPVFHVAGTNGKGSTVAFLRACLEASGYRVHVYTSPHLVRFNERIRLAGQLIRDEELLGLFRDVLAINAGKPITTFEVTTALALLAFARTPADACILEVGMGGRLDATNVVEAPAMCGIAQLGLDHVAFLGDNILAIAGEKAAIAKSGAPLVVSRYPSGVTRRIAEVAALAGAPLIQRGLDWDAAPYGDQMHYKDAAGRLELPLPRLAGAHQLDNAGLAIAMLRHQSVLDVPDAAFRAGLGWAEWPARLQPITLGPLFDRLPAGATLTLDGAHNPSGARALAHALSQPPYSDGRPIHLIVALLDTKDLAGVLKPLSEVATSLIALVAPGQDCHPPEAVVAQASAFGLAGEVGTGIEAALDMIARMAEPDRPPHVIVCGSLYLAGHVLSVSGLSPN